MPSAGEISRFANPHPTRAMVTRTFDLQESDRSREKLTLLIAMTRNFARGQTYTMLAKLSAKDLCDRFSANPWPRINTDENFLRRKRIAAKLMAGLSREDITDKRTRHIREETKPFR
jgi:hypothetical protein